MCVQFQRSISENSLVAMDFSGQKSRVIENPSEALSVAVEEGLSWRVSQGIAHKTLSTRETTVRDISQFCKQEKRLVRDDALFYNSHIPVSPSETMHS